MRACEFSFACIRACLCVCQDVCLYVCVRLVCACVLCVRVYGFGAYLYVCACVCVDGFYGIVWFLWDLWDLWGSTYVCEVARLAFRIRAYLRVCVYVYACVCVLRACVLRVRGPGCCGVLWDLWNLWDLTRTYKMRAR